MYVAKLMVSYLVKLYLFKITLRLYQNHTPIFTTSLADFHKITLRLYQNHTPIFTKSLADFHNITSWFSQNHIPTLPKSHSDFTKITLRLYQNHWPIFTTSLADFHKITLRLCQNHTPALPKSPTDFHKITDWFSQKRGLILKPQMLFYCTPFQNRTLPHCASCLSEGFSSFVASLSGSPHCFVLVREKNT